MPNEVIAYRVSEFCQRFVLSKATFYREVTARRIRIIKRGASTLVTRTEAERWFQELCKSQQKPVA